MTPPIPSDRTRVRLWMERLTLARAIRTIVLVALLMVVVGAVLERVVEPSTFDDIGLSLWWSVTTLTTVGYGDIVPVSTAGRIVGAALMLAGVSLIPLVTSIAVSILTAKRTQDLHDQQVVRLAQIERQLEELRGVTPPAAPPSEPS